jgi:hypothetical protein
MPYGVRYLARETLAAVRVSSSNLIYPLVSLVTLFRTNSLMLPKNHAQPASAASSSIGISTRRSCEWAYITWSLYAALSVPVSSTPETFDIVSTTVDVSSRKNLAQISKVLSQVTSGLEFGDETPSYIPINEYVKRAILQFTSWLFEGRYSHGSSLSCV